MNCKLDHSAEGFPAFLCRACHPELVPTAEKRQEWADRTRAAQDKMNLQQELLRTRQKVESMSREGEPDPCFVPIKARVYGSLVKKVQRLEKELERVA